MVKASVWTGCLAIRLVSVHTCRDDMPAASHTNGSTVLQAAQHAAKQSFRNLKPARNYVLGFQLSPGLKGGNSRLSVVDVFAVAVFHPQVPAQCATVCTVMPRELGCDLELHPYYRPAPRSGSIVN